VKCRTSLGDAPYSFRLARSLTRAGSARRERRHDEPSGDRYRYCTHPDAVHVADAENVPLSDAQFDWLRLGPAKQKRPST